MNIDFHIGLSSLILRIGERREAGENRREAIG
jgi:hypothetical protein